MEHEFQKPKIDDLESLFDLVTALVSILQTAMTTSFHEEIEFIIHNEDWKSIKGSFVIYYQSEEKTIYVSWSKKKLGEIKSGDDTTEVKATLEDPEKFAYFFRVLVLLNQLEGYASYEHIKTKIKA